MSLPTPDQKQQIVAAHGLDPSQWTTSDDGMTLISTTSPVKSLLPDMVEETPSAVQPTPAGHSPMETFVKSAINKGPAMAGTGVGAGAGLALGLGLAPETFGLSMLIPLIGAIGGGYVGGKAVSAAQDALTPDSYKKEIADLEAENPKSAMAAELATLPLGGFWPNPKNIVRAAGTAGKLISRLGAAPEEIANLANVGLGGAIGGVQPLIQGQTDPKEILKSVGEGLLFNTPNPIGNRLGFHSVKPRQSQQPDVVAGMLNKAPAIQEAPPSDVVNPAPSINPYLPDVASTIGGIPFTKSEINTGRVPAGRVVFNEETGKYSKPVMRGVKEVPKELQTDLGTQQSELDAMTAEGGPVRLDPADLALKQRIEAVNVQRKPQANKPSGEGFQTPEGDATPAPTDHQNKYNTEALPKATDEVLTPAAKSLVQRAALLKDRFPDLDVSRITPEFFNMWARDISALHGVKATANPELAQFGVSHFNEEGKSLGTSEVNLEKADAGTPGHEDTHHIWSSLDEAGKAKIIEATKPEFEANAAEREAHNKLHNLTPGDEGYKKPFDAEEFFSTQMGYKALERTLTGTGDTGLKQWWNDTKSQWNTKYGKNPTADDLYRAHVYRLLNGISDVRGSIARPVVGAGAVGKNQDESGLPQDPAERKRQLSRERRAAQAAEISDIRAGQPARDAGAIPNTWEDRRAQLISPLTEDVKDAEGNVTQEGELTQIKNLVNKTINKVTDIGVNEAGRHIPMFNEEQRTDVYDSVIADITSKGVDDDGLTSTAIRRARDYINEEIKRNRGVEYGGEKLKGISLDAPVGEGKSTAGEKIAGSRLAENPQESFDIEGAGTDEVSTEDVLGSKSGDKVESEEISYEGKSSREAAAGKHMRLADDLHWEYQDSLDSAENKLEELKEHLADADDEMAPKLEAGIKKLEAGLPKLKATLKELEGHFGEQVDVNEWTRKAQGIVTKAQGEGLPKQKKYGLVHGLEAAFNKVEHYSPEVAQGLRNWEVRKRELTGAGNATLTDLSKFPKNLVTQVFNTHRNSFRSGTPLPVMSGEAGKVSAILKNYFSNIADVRRASGMKINGREAGKVESYVPDQLNDTILKQFTEDGSSVESDRLKGIWSRYVSEQSKGDISVVDARKNVDAYVAALGGKNNNYLSVAFGAIRKAQGYGLPESLRDLDPISVVTKYNRRASGDLAMFMELESKPRIAAALHMKDPTTGQVPPLPEGVREVHDVQDVRNAMKWVTGGFSGSLSTSSPKFNALIRVINNALMGFGTGARDLVSVPLNTIPYINKWSDLGAAMKGFRELRVNSRKALETGAKQPHLDKIIFDDLKNSPDWFMELAHKTAAGLRKWQGREAIENISRDVTFSIGKGLVKNNILYAKLGHEPSIKFLKKFDTLVGDITKLEGPALEKAVDTMAANVSDRVQGTYGGRGLPTGMVDSPFAPFWALQKWSVEKSNVIYEDVITPFITGENRLPIITYTLGSVLTGAAIQQLNELMSGKKSSDPTVMEVVKAGRTQDYVAQLATLMQLGSYAGIVGDLAKWMTDVGIYGKTPRNIISFPTATAALDTQEKTTDMFEALRNGENPFDVFKEYATDIFVKNVQTIRMLANRTVNDSQAERTDKFRDLRVFGQLSGQPNKDFAPSNKYLGLAARKFKKTDNIQEAAGEVGGLVKGIIQKSGGNAEDRQRRLKGLKANSYQTMPSMEGMPLQFAKYYQYLQKTIGPEAAKARLQDYMKQNGINRAKSAMIPTF